MGEGTITFEGGVPTPPAAMGQAPSGTRLAHLRDQAVLVVLAALAVGVAARGSYVAAVLDPHLAVAVPWPGAGTWPGPFPVWAAIAVLATGMAASLTRARSVTVAWCAFVAALAVLTVIESDRLNWVAFLSGVSFRLIEGPVPLRRGVAVLVALLASVGVLAGRSLHAHVEDLAARGLPVASVRALRARLLRYERIVLVGSAVAGLVLLLVIKVSMELTEAAPELDTDGFAAWAWTVLLLGVLIGSLAHLVRNSPTGRPGARTPPGR